MPAEEGQQLVYAMHSPQNWLEDFGSGRLVAGEAWWRLDSAFAKVVSVDAPYHVFLTPLGDWPAYVTIAYSGMTRSRPAARLLRAASWQR